MQSQVDTHKVLMKESGVNLTLTVVDTPGFGDAVDNSGCWDPVNNYVEQQYEAFLDAETRFDILSLLLLSTPLNLIRTRYCPKSLGPSN